MAVVIPALNEAENLALLLPQLRDLGVGQVVVGDNGSTDDTRAVAAVHGTLWTYEPRRGYGAACAAAIARLDPRAEIVAFMDADLSVDAAELRSIVEPIDSGQCEFVVAVRPAQQRERGSMTRPQRMANKLFPWLIQHGWGYRYTDLGPFRAIRRDALERMRLKDRAYGWTVEMQIRAVELGLRIRELPVAYRTRRRGQSKVSGNLRGVVQAAYWMTRTCAWMWLTKRKRRWARVR